MPQRRDCAPPIAILLATFNGGLYLRQQLESLWAQTRQDFVVLARDDGSSDDTLAILEAEQSLHPSQMCLIQDDLGRLGPARSFIALLQHTKAQWVAFCDQDDFWLPQKLERQVAALIAVEHQCSVDMPSLCCTDVAVTDEELRVVARSYFERHDFSISDGRDTQLARLLFRNYAIGAATMINSALALRARSMPSEAIMHDWWCALLACVSGRTVVLPEALIQYRQHGANAVGSRSRAKPTSIGELRAYVQELRAKSVRSIRQAGALSRLVSTPGLQTSEETRRVLRRYESFGTSSRLKRCLTLFGTRAFKSGAVATGLHVYACITASL